MKSHSKRFARVRKSASRAVGMFSRMQRKLEHHNTKLEVLHADLMDQLDGLQQLQREIAAQHMLNRATIDNISKITGGDAVSTK